MKIEAGKVYRCRDGRKARIYATDGDANSPVHGAFWENNCTWHSYTWAHDGRDRIALPSPLDLIEEWKEPLVVEFESRVESQCGIVNDSNLYKLSGKRVKVRVEEIL